MLLLIGFKTSAQDIEPRRWSTLPINKNFVGVGYGYAYGKIYFDPVLDVKNASVDISSFAVSYVRSFSLGKKLGRFDVLLPYSIARWEGILAGSPTSVTRNGISDPRLRLSVNILGPDAMELSEIQDYMSTHPVYTVVGVSLAITVPFGQYFDDKLLNIGQNRFVFRPQAGFVHNWRRWSFEWTGSIYFFTNNNDFFSNTIRKQDPIFAMQTHLIRQFKNRTWVSLSLGTGLAGQSVLNNVPNNDEREDILGAFSFGVPMMKNQSLKFVYLRSQTLNDIGGNINSFGFIWSATY